MCWLVGSIKTSQLDIFWWMLNMGKILVMGNVCGWQVVGQEPRMVHTHGVCATTKSLHLRRTTARPICFTPVLQALVTMAEEHSLYTGMCVVSFRYMACVDGTLITDNGQS